MSIYDMYPGCIILRVATFVNDWHGHDTHKRLYGLTPEARGWSCNAIDTIAAKLIRIRNS